MVWLNVNFRRVFLILSLVGLIASLFPSFEFSHPFWGASLSKARNDTVYVTIRDPYSPAGRSGLQDHDFILDSDGVDALDEKFEQLKPRETMHVKVRRNKTLVDVTLTGEQPIIADVWYTNQIMTITGGLMLVFFEFGLLTRVPRSIQKWTLAPIIIVLLLLTIRTGVVIAEEGRSSHFSLYWGRAPRSEPNSRSFGQDYVTIAVLFSLALLLSIKLTTVLMAAKNSRLTSSDAR